MRPLVAISLVAVGATAILIPLGNHSGDLNAPVEDVDIHSKLDIGATALNPVNGPSESPTTTIVQEAELRPDPRDVLDTSTDAVPDIVPDASTDVSSGESSADATSRGVATRKPSRTDVVPRVNSDADSGPDVVMGTNDSPILR